jgi:chorismate synthase
MLRFLTAGESHGKALVGIIEGLPSQISLVAEDLQKDLRRRKLGYGRGTRQKMEDDAVQILSGVRHGKSLGSPIALCIENKDYKNWLHIMQPEPYDGPAERLLEVPRPGHADYVGGLKYQHEDMRNVLERASARETTIRVALGAVARKFLSDLDIHIASRVIQIGRVADTSQVPHPVQEWNHLIDQRPTRCFTPEVDQKMVQLIEQAKKDGDTLGGIFEVAIDGLPLGLGSYVQWDRRLEGDLSKAMMSLNAIKGVEIGRGFELAKIPGSEAHDSFVPAGKPHRVISPTNHAGGIVGGMTTGQRLLIKAAMKPIATLMSPLPSVKLSNDEITKAHVERSDVCAVPAAAVIGESLMALELAKQMLEKFGGDSLEEIKSRVDEWRKNT